MGIAGQFSGGADKIERALEQYRSTRTIYLGARVTWSIRNIVGENLGSELVWNVDYLYLLIFYHSEVWGLNFSIIIVLCIYLYELHLL